MTTTPPEVLEIITIRNRSGQISRYTIRDTPAGEIQRDTLTKQLRRGDIELWTEDGSA